LIVVLTSRAAFPCWVLQYL